MARRGEIFGQSPIRRACKHIIERQPVGDALRADPQRPRGEHVDVAMPEAGPAAAIIDAAELPLA